MTPPVEDSTGGVTVYQLLTAKRYAPGSDWLEELLDVPVMPVVRPIWLMLDCAAPVP